MKPPNPEMMKALQPGVVIERLTIITAPRPGVRPSGKKERMCLCRCQCGKEREFIASWIYKGRIKSCGCLKNDKFKDMTARTFTTHGRTDTTEYRSYSMMMDRCENPNNKQFNRYGGRGITVCDRWKNGNGIKRGPELFLDDMGPKPAPDFSIERIHNDKGYSPENCKWADCIEQANNQRPKRKGIPNLVKNCVMERQDRFCSLCGEPFSLDNPAEFDHRPPLILREVDYSLKVYIPDQLNPDFIEALHAPCHLFRTTGRKPGATKTSTTLGSDVGVAAKFRRLANPKKKAKIPSRKKAWPKRKFRSAK